MIINPALAQMGPMQTQQLGKLFDGYTRHLGEGLTFKARAQNEGCETAVEVRDEDPFNWI